MVLKPKDSIDIFLLMFENDVKTYGTETIDEKILRNWGFENDVKTYGTETVISSSTLRFSLRMM